MLSVHKDSGPNPLDLGSGGDPAGRHSLLSRTSVWAAGSQRASCFPLSCHPQVSEVPGGQSPHAYLTELGELAQHLALLPPLGGGRLVGETLGPRGAVAVAVAVTVPGGGALRLSLPCELQAGHPTGQALHLRLLGNGQDGGGRREGVCDSGGGRFLGFCGCKAKGVSAQRAGGGGGGLKE